MTAKSDKHCAHFRYGPYLILWLVEWKNILKQWPDRRQPLLFQEEEGVEVAQNLRPSKTPEAVHSRVEGLERGGRLMQIGQFSRSLASPGRGSNGGVGVSEGGEEEGLAGLADGGEAEATVVGVEEWKGQESIVPTELGTSDHSEVLKAKDHDTELSSVKCGNVSPLSPASPIHGENNTE